VDRLDDAPTRNPRATKRRESGSLNHESEEIQDAVSELAL